MLSSQDLKCPITKQYFLEPVIAADGHIYEKTAIERWLSNNNTSPLTNQVLENKILQKIHIINRILNDTITEKPQIKNEQYEKEYTYQDAEKFIKEKKYDELLKCTNFNIDSCIKNILKTAPIYIQKHVIDCSKLNAQYKYNYTLLHFACEYGKFEIVKYLVDKNANLEFKTSTYLTPLHLVCRYGTIESIKYLIDHNADLTAKTCSGLTPAHIICRYGDYESIKYMTDKNIDMTCEDDNGISPIDNIFRYQVNKTIIHTIGKFQIDITTYNNFGKLVEANAHLTKHNLLKEIINLHKKIE